MNATKVIRVDDEVYEFIAANARGRETKSETLTRLLEVCHHPLDERIRREGHGALGDYVGVHVLCSGCGHDFGEVDGD